MKKLILMRHAKSSWSESDITDIERTLGERGRKGADVIGQWLAGENLKLDQAIISTATRCQETWARVSSSLTAQPDVLNEAALYMAGTDGILDIIRNNAKGDTVLIVGHQPGIGALARELRIDPAPHHATFDKYPTGATTVLSLPIDDWAALDYGIASLDTYITPKDLG